jgi:hypothetical protein
MNNSWHSFLRRQDAAFVGASVLRFGNGASAYLDPNDTVFSPVNWMGIARVSGSDATEFLQAQLTGDIRKIEPGISGISGYCNPKGRLLAIFRILRDGDDFILLSDSGILPGILQRLQMYVLRMKVDLVVETSRAVIGLAGPGANHIATELAGSAAEITNEVFCSRRICSIPLGNREKGYLIIAPHEQLMDSWTTIRSGAQLAGSDQWALFEMRSGLARITTTTRELFIPQSVNLDLIDGVSFSKGCYPGQEIVARVRYLGRLKHRMARALVTQGGLPTPGDPIFLNAQTTQRAGTVINAVDLPSGAGELLATVPLGSPTGTEFSLDQAGRSIRLVDVPTEAPEGESQ